MKRALLAAMAISLLPFQGTAQSAVEPASPTISTSPDRQTVSETQGSPESTVRTRQAPEVKEPATNSSAGDKATPTIYEFSDLQCPDSAAFAAQGKQRLMREFVAPGKVNYSFHDFPLESHPLAVPAAEVARCAGPASDEVRRQLLQSQGSWQSEQELLQRAASAGVDPQKLQQCMASGQKRSDVQQDKSLGKRYGVSATPTLVLGYTDANGAFTPVNRVRGDQPYEKVRSAVQELIAQSNASGVKKSVGRSENQVSR